MQPHRTQSPQKEKRLCIHTLQEKYPIVDSPQQLSSPHALNTTLTAPNGIKVVDDFRMYVLSNNWYPTDVPLAEVAPADPVELGYNQPDGHNAGTRQIFLYREICWTSSRGIYTASVGRAFWTLFKHLPNQLNAQLI